MGPRVDCWGVLGQIWGLGLRVTAVLGKKKVERSTGVVPLVFLPTDCNYDTLQVM